MNQKYQVDYQPLAQQSLEEICGYLVEEAGSDVATRWLQALIRSVDQLEVLPKAYPIFSRHREHDVYSKPVGSYRVHYLVDDESQTVQVIDVVHMARDSRLAQYRGD